MVVTERLYLAADKKTVVKEGDKRAAYLLAAKGQEIPNVIAKQYGLIKKKKAKKPENKALRGALEKWGYMERPKAPWLRLAPEYQPKPMKFDD